MGLSQLGRWEYTLPLPSCAPLLLLLFACVGCPGISSSWDGNMLALAHQYMLHLLFQLILHLVTVHQALQRCELSQPPADPGLSNPGEIQAEKCNEHFVHELRDPLSCSKPQEESLSLEHPLHNVTCSTFCWKINLLLCGKPFHLTSRMALLR